MAAGIVTRSGLLGAAAVLALGLPSAGWAQNPAVRGVPEAIVPEAIVPEAIVPMPILARFAVPAPAAPWASLGFAPLAPAPSAAAPSRVATPPRPQPVERQLLRGLPGQWIWDLASRG